MTAANALQHLVVHGLGIDGNAADLVGGHNPQFFLGDGLGPAGLHGIFPAGRPVKVGIHRREQRLQLLLVEGGGSAAADIDAAQGDVVFPQQLSGRLHLLQQAVHIGLHHMAPSSHIVADEGAVAALCRAEGDADIQLGLPGEQAVLGGKGVFRRADTQLAAVFGDVIVGVQPGVQFSGRKALPDGKTGRLGGLHAGHAAPGGALVQQRHQGLVDGGLDTPGQHPFIFLAVGLRGNGTAHLVKAPLFAPNNLRAGADLAIFLPGTAETALAGKFFYLVMTLIGQKGDQHLLDAVVTVVSL